MEVATLGDVAMLTVPLNAVPDLARDLASSLAGKVVLDSQDQSGKLERAERLPRTLPENSLASGVKP